jgi:hypothetical protein
VVFGVVSTMFGLISCIAMGLNPNGSHSNAEARSLTFASADTHAYACVPAAATLVLAHYGFSAQYGELVREMNVGPDGRASLGSLVRACEKRGLYAAGFSGLCADRVGEYVRGGFVVVARVGVHGGEHAISLFGQDGMILAADLIDSPFTVNKEALMDLVSTNPYCVVIGRRPIPNLGGLQHRWPLLLTFPVIVVCIYLFRISLPRKRVIG